MANPFNRDPKIYRVPVNPMDRATIVSVFPKPLVDKKVTLSPGTWEVPAAPPGDFSLLVVGPSSWFKEQEEGQPFLEMIVPSTEIARSIIDDYASGLLGVDMVDRKPGLFFLPGEFTKTTIITQPNFTALLAAANMRQRAWFLELVRIADALWIRTSGQLNAISDDMRLAAKTLNLSDKPWLSDYRTVELVRCIACGALGDPRYPVCATCKAIINKDLAKKLDIQFAV